MARRSGRTGAVEVEGKSRKDMNELLKINYETEQPKVSARDLHAGLEIKSKYADWFKNMSTYGFTENEDYMTVSKNLENGGRIIEHFISVDMAKQICMIQRNEKGRRADADRVKHRLSVRNVPKPRIELLPFLKPLPEADGRQQDSERRGQTEMVEACRDCPGLVRNVRPSKGVTRTVTPCRMLTNVNVENIMRGSQIVIPLPLIGSKKG